MYQAYQNYKIVLYYSQHTQQLVGWAKTFWLLKTAHPIIAVCFDEEDLLVWIQKNHNDTRGLFVPPTIRPLVEIDFLNDSHTANRVSILEDGSKALCVIDPEEKSFTPTHHEGVFEDLSCYQGKIEEEIKGIKETLLLNI